MDNERENVELADYISIVWRRRFFIIVGTFVAMIVAAVFSLLQPNVYRATASLVVIPPKFQTELAPSTLSIHTYINLLTSPELMKAIIDTLLLEETTVEGLNRNLSTEIITEKYGTQRIAYSPLIHLHAQADSPEKAAHIANTWAEKFVEQNKNLSSKGKESSLNFIEEQFPISKEKLEKAENTLNERQDYYEEELKRFKDLWQKRILDFKARWKIDLLKEELKVIENKLIDFQSELINVRFEIKTAREDLREIGAELKKQPQFLIVAKAITDDALWERVEKDSTGKVLEGLDRLKLRSEVPNPVHEDLSRWLSNTRIKLETLIPKEQYLISEIQTKNGEVDSLTKLIYTKEFELDQLERERDVKLEILQREKLLELLRLKRNVEKHKSTYDNLAKKSESAELAKAEESEDIKIAARAVEPGRKIGPNRKQNVMVAGVVAMIVVVLVAFLWEYVQSPTKRSRVRVQENSTQ